MHNSGSNYDLGHRMCEIFLVNFLPACQEIISYKYNSKECNNLSPSLIILEQNKLFAAENIVFTQK
jgi:hypothetical protein